MTIEDLYPTARRLAARRARVPDDRDDLTQEGMLALTLAARRGALDHARDEGALARTIIDRAMLGYYSRSSLRGDLMTSLREDRYPPPERLRGRVAEEDLFLSSYLRALTEAEGEEYAWVAENLIHPTDELGAWVLREMAAKAECVVHEGIDLRAWDTARVSGRVIREALGWSRGRWREVIESVRAFTVEWAAHHGVELR